MGNIQDRPYAGTWKLNRRTVVKYTPDALVFLNGDTSLPGCPRCRGRVDIQKFVTSISVEAGTGPTSHSATIQLALPRVQGEQIFIDGYNILRAGLEVHIFMRGYFPIRGMFKHLADPQAGRNLEFRNPTDNDQLDLSKYATYPYYPVFHGVLTQVSYEYGDGFYHGSLQCASLLHFWNFVNITTGGAWMAQDSRPTNDPGRPTLFGHNFNNTHPFSIIYTLYRDIAGSAAGVDYALSEESNLSAANTEGGRQLFDQISLYWEQRFKTRIQTLRMYGTNGQLFNAAQQAWLGSADTRDGQRLLPSPTFNDSETTRTEQDPLSTRLSVAKALGLQNAGADFIYSPLMRQDNELFNLSVLDMFAFNQTIAEMGATNLWVSTYQTKMDVAQQVMEVTGYEFYQDVDGDLVFKPPFWNLDVSTNRYYRLEDSDIISISFTEKEPTATYIIVKGIWIAGLKDATPDAPELNKRGLYIDYKLVAKFGWRPAPSLEITYQTDPKVLFWIGVARLDALNVDTFSASATIPIRAELRPGYPVYIPFCDCYYYITQFSHSFSFGGQCTTSLVLTCRRAKWHAPGFLEPAEEGQSAINKIRLDRPDLPPRPLEIFNNGIPRIVGFPNVVMALDPRQFNPNFSVVGVGIDYFDQFDANTSADLLFSWLQRDVSSLQAFEAVGIDTLPDGTQIVGNPDQIQRFRLRFSDNPERVIEFSLDDLIRAFSDYKQAAASVSTAQNAVDAQQAAVGNATAADNAFDPARASQGTSTGTARATALASLDTLEGQLQTELRTLHRNLGENQSLQLLVLIFDALQPVSNKPIRRKVDGIAGSDVTLSYFETLSHLKGQYLAHTAPGNYRYFSCSHPFPSQQGMPIIEWDDGDRGTESAAQGGGRRTGGGRRRRGAVSTRFFPSGNNLFETVAEALASLPGIDNWLDPTGMNQETRKLYGLTSKRRTAAEEQMDERVAQNLMDIGSVVNTIVNRWLARPDYQEAVRDSDGFVLGNPTLLSGFRPSLEPADAEAQHSQGVAIDVTFANGGNSAAAARGVTAQHQAAIRAVREEVLTAFNEGLIRGMGFYILDKADGGTFVHMDRRNIDTAKAIQARRGGALPALTGAWTQGVPKPIGWKDFGNSVGIPYRPAKLVEPEDKLVLGDSPFPPVEDSNETPADLPAPSPVPQTRPNIQTRAVSADTARLVVQFKPTVTLPEGEGGLRAPEAELGVGRCDQGIQIALGPQRTPKVLTTDQIQSISFVRHAAKKFASVVGVSQQSGRVGFNATTLQKQLTAKLLEAAQNLDNTEQTLADLFQDVYTQIGEDLASVAIPTFDAGVPGEPTTIEIPSFPDALVVTPEALPPSVLSMLQASMGDLDHYNLSNFTLAQLACVPGYVASGAQRDNGQGGQRQAQAAASNYANEITKAVEAKFAEVQTAALEPPDAEKQNRLSAIQAAFNEAAGKAMGPEQVVSMTNEFVTQESTPKEGKLESPLHSPVFPVSDEKGYEHYGAYRYGRGLSVERGGTFEFIHSGQDPFKNVTAQTAEEFLRVFTLVKQGKTGNDFLSNTLRGVQEGAAKAVEFILNQRQEPLSEDVAALPSQATTTGEAVVGAGDVVQKVGLSETERVQVEQSVLDLAQVVTELGQTSRGQDVLHELLVSNGDNPDILQQDSFDITDTQFARNFVNFAANYGKSPVFKTVAANAAYALADLTAHLTSRAGDACVCRGSYSDVLLAAYARQSFVAVEGINQTEQKATAFASEEIIKMADGHVQQQREYRGQILRGEQPDAQAFTSAGGGTESVAAGAPLPQAPLVPAPSNAGTVSPENPPTTANPAELPPVESVGIGILPDVETVPGPIQPLEFDEDGEIILLEEEGLPDVGEE